MVAATGQDEFYTYDGLYQLQTFQRGTLNGTNTGLTGTPAWEEDFSFDAPGNWTHYTNKVSGVTNVNQSRAHNAANEITRIAGVQFADRAERGGEHHQGAHAGELEQRLHDGL